MRKVVCPKPTRSKELVMTAIMAIITGLSAQLCIYVGPVPYTMQNFGVMLSGLILSPRYAFLSQLLYLVLIAMGLPLAAGMKGGIGVLMGLTAGYLWSFPIAATLASSFARPFIKRKRIPTTWAICALSSIPIYMLGIIWLWIWIEVFGETCIKRWVYTVAHIMGLSNYNMTSALIFSGMLIFMPQDFFIDHTLAIAVALKVLEYFKISFDYQHV